VTGPDGPPWIAEALLRRVLPRGTAGESILGDAHEDFVRRARERGWARARLAYGWLAVRLLGAYALPRVWTSGMGVAMGMTVEIRRAWRGMLRRPGSAAAAVAVLGLGIGLCTFMFSIIFGIFFRGLGLPQEEELRVVYAVAPSVGPARVALLPADIEAVREGLGSVDGVAAYWTAPANLVWSGGATRLSALYVSGAGLSLLRVSPALGRLPPPAGDVPGGEAGLVLSDRAWREELGGDPAVLGLRVAVNGRATAVVGVMPEGFRFPQNEDAWLALDPRLDLGGLDDVSPPAVYARLSPGVDPERLDAELAALSTGLRAGEEDRAFDWTLTSAAPVELATGSRLFALFTAMAGAVGLVLVVACANVANLLLARASLHAREVGVRVALGCSRLRVLVPFLTEALLLASLGALLGVGLAAAGIEAMDAVVTTERTGRPYFIRFALDGPALAFTGLLTGGTAVLAGIAPALRSSALPVAATLRGDGRGTPTLRPGRLAQVLVVVEVALSCALLVGAGVMTRSLVDLGRHDLGFDPAPVLTARMGLTGPAYPDQASRSESLDALLERLRAAPGLEAAALSDELPAHDARDARLEVAGSPLERPEDLPRASVLAVSEGFFEVLGRETLQGRPFTSADGIDAPPVAIVDAPLARALFPDGRAVGGRVRVHGSEDWRTVVAVAPDVTPQGFERGARPGGLYVPLRQSPTAEVSILVRVRLGPAAAAAPALREAVRTVDPELPLHRVAPLEDRIAQGTWFYGIFGSLFVVFGLASLLMASIGLYGVLSFSVATRRSELGMRMALGAAPSAVLGLVARQSGTQVAAGVALGLLLAWSTVSAVTALSFQADPRDPVVFAGVAVVVAVVAAVATWVPALRAVRVDPARALRGG
jgi:predicted permease